MKDSTDCEELSHPPSPNQGLSRAEDITVDKNSDQDSSKNSVMNSEPNSENAHNIKQYTSNKTVHVTVRLHRFMACCVTILT
jgi:hypothetical protein